MKTVKIIIEKTEDLYSAYAENVEGIYGACPTATEAKRSIVNAIALLKKHNRKEKIPTILKGDYRLIFKFDPVSLLNYYKGVLSNAALERMTRINQKLLQHYSSGLKKPRATQTKRFETALHELGRELIAIEL